MPGRSRPLNRFTPERLAALKKAQQALELRMAARTWQEIAEALGYKDPTGPLFAVKSLLRSSLQTPIEEYRQLNAERLTKVMQVHWRNMIAGNPISANIVMRAIQQLSGLMGLEAPVKIQIDLRTEAEKVAREQGLPLEDVLREAEAVIRAATK